ncbi:MAG: hypothetical protein KDA85_08530, partial [Planctomycetaceae bacterium]|nr:hypothetical protein [Planctomycetaceae bacterium]
MAESPSVLQFCRKAADRILSPVLRWHGAQPAQFAKYGNTLGPLVNRRYQSYADMCHSQSGEQRDETGVRSAGSVLIRNVMPTDDALQLSAKVDACIRSQDPRAAVAESTAQVMRSIRNPITTLGRSVVEIFAHPDVNQQIRAYFGSHFRIQWLDCYRSLPTTEVSHSWLWHSD